MKQNSLWMATVAALAVAVGCGGAEEDGVRHDLSQQADRFAATSGDEAEAGDTDFSEGLPAYLAYAMAHSPELRASFERWQASVHRISRSRRLPETTLSFGIFVQSVETRVGPQQARLGLQQSFPWPTKLTAGADSASARARAQQRRFEAEALVVTERVSNLYWRLWQIRENGRVHGEHIEVVRALSESVGARVATGATTLADQQQVDLTAARIEDTILGLHEAERASVAQLRALLSAPRGADMPTPHAPAEARLPTESHEDMMSAVANHPLIASFSWMAQAQDEAARAQEADRYPSFTVGVDWIITGDATTPGVQGSGRDAVIVGAGIRLPLFQGSYSDGIDAARADANAERAEQEAATELAVGELEAALSAVRNSVRRVRLYHTTLVPQAETAYASVLGAYATGRGTVAQTLLAQGTLLELRVEQDLARAMYAQSWARLELVTGHNLDRGPGVDPDQAPGAPENERTEQVDDGE
ncbi:MAG: TolC family protein [Deltaproteobacteria bacterium]|nr:TolC family protein [Deltaproteobacteria bacterium]